MALGTANPRELILEIQERRRLEEEAQRLNEPTQSDREFQPLPSAGGRGAQALPAAGEEPLQPVPTSEKSPLQQSSDRLAAQTQQAAESDRLGQKNENRETGDANNAAVQGVRDTVAKGTKAVGDSLSRAKETARQAMHKTSHKYGRQYNEVNERVAAENEAKNIGELKEQYEHLRPQFEAYAEENPWILKSDDPWGDFLEMSLIEEGTDLGTRADGMTKGKFPGSDSAAADVERNMPSELERDDEGNVRRRLRKDGAGRSVPVAPLTVELNGESPDPNADLNARRTRNHTIDPETGKPRADNFTEDGMHPDINLPEHLRGRTGGNSSTNPIGGKGGKGSMRERGMHMGPDGHAEEATTQLIGDMNQESWDAMTQPEREAHVMYLANQLGFGETVAGLPPEDQYAAAKRMVFSHLYKTGDGATRIWANEEAGLGENTEFIDPNKKAMRVNKWNDNTGQWELRTSGDSRDRAKRRSAAAFAARSMKGHSQVEKFANEDGTLNAEAAREYMLERIKPADSENLTENEQLALDQGMRLLEGDFQQHYNVKQDKLDRGRGQLQMMHRGTPMEHRLTGRFLRELDEAGDDPDAQLRVYQKHGLAGGPQGLADQKAAETQHEQDLELVRAGRKDADSDIWADVDTAKGTSNKIAVLEASVPRRENETQEAYVTRLGHMVRDREISSAREANNNQPLTPEQIIELPSVRDHLDEFYSNNAVLRQTLYDTYIKGVSDTEWSEANKAAHISFVQEALRSLRVNKSSNPELWNAYAKYLSNRWFAETGVARPKQGAEVADIPQPAAEAEPAAPQARTPAPANPPPSMGQGLRGGGPTGVPVEAGESNAERALGALNGRRPTNVRPGASSTDAIPRYR